MCQISKSRARLGGYLSLLLTVFLGALFVTARFGQGATRTSTSGSSGTAAPLAGGPRSNRPALPPNKFIIIYTLSDPGAGEVGDIRYHLITGFKNQESEDDSRKSIIEPSTQEQGAAVADCQKQSIYCDVVRVRETDSTDRMIIELSVTSIPPKKHPHDDIDDFTLPVCNTRDDWDGCRDRRIDQIVGKLAGLERHHLQGW